jgi:uncharacterized surface protein with fasciclin (FAS1) repeats
MRKLTAAALAAALASAIGAATATAAPATQATTDKTIAQTAAGDPRFTTLVSKLQHNGALLRRVLLYHVLAGDVKAAQVVKLRSARTLAGPRVRIRVRYGSVYLNGNTKVVQTDIAAANGIIHAINRVLLPPSM